MSRRTVYVGLILVLVIGVAACGSLDDDPVVPARDSDIVTPSPEPTATSLPTGTPLPTATPPEASAPTSTPVESVETPTPTEAAEIPEEAAPATEPDVPTEPLGTFSEEVDALLAEREGIYSVVVTSQYDEISYWHDGSHLLEAASLYKLPVMVEIFRQREAGILDFSDTIYLEEAYFNEADGDVYDESYIGAEVTIEELMTDMITLSSNVAAYALLQHAGTYNINSTMLELGLASTEIRWSPIASTEPSEPVAVYAWLQESDEPAPTERADEAFNVTSAEDMALLFQLMLEGSLVSPEASAEMLDLLEHQQVNYLLPAGLPEGVAVAHKTGTLPGLTHDAGVIYTSSGPVVVSALVESDYEGEAIEFIQQLAWLVYTFSEQVAAP